MIFLGLLLVLLAGGAVTLVLTEDTARYILFGYTFELNHVEMFLAGAAAAAVLLLGLWLMSAGSRRTAKRRRKLRSARAEASSRVAQLEDEKRDLERKLERDRKLEQERKAAHEPEPGDHLVARGSADTTP
ncbi:hypothetical protein [Nonomuraea zeae]|uniref:LapA family protein n=1 Tax=Nonomuraea zeae TaxID=1642303 RepID=A0A5S4H7B4_9ACTN|nr:hypothetical protein [Nonomuraea zeae]TMR34740.1 hypothetical protein ETD85_15800 [Nonomuraea zeae]